MAHEGSEMTLRLMSTDCVTLGQMVSSVKSCDEAQIDFEAANSCFPTEVDQLTVR